VPEATGQPDVADVVGQAFDFPFVRSSDRLLCGTQAIDYLYPHTSTYIPQQYTHIFTSVINIAALARLSCALLSPDFSIYFLLAPMA
jgi:hypothetical protein